MKPASQVVIRIEVVIRIAERILKKLLLSPFSGVTDGAKNVISQLLYGEVWSKKMQDVEPHVMHGRLLSLFGVCTCD